MAFSTLPLRASVPAPPTPSGRDLPLRRQHRIQFPTKDLQGRSKIQETGTVNNVLRRDAVLFLSAGLFSTLLSVDSAEARRAKPETKKKLIEKLREKAKISKEQSHSSSEGQEKLPSPSNLAPQVEAAVGK
ncbi:hypothetical protein J5N97_004071 [Dioscorea zingiberensis]|uniref:Uncharacterized protein n=1 Tax=Dioscorea zingiberensis TaxID=325984 RepID=A0A9D5D5D1_9LILI|nr:hypothetical protein J5N97_004071 [Dioscorea zingiberensis]